MGETKVRNILFCCLGLFVFLMFSSVSQAWALTTSALTDQTCAGYRSGGKLGCTAGEFTVAPVFSAAPGTPPFCIAGQSFSFQVDLGLSGTNADRYNIGFFVGQNGNDPTATTAGNNCSVATFPLSPLPWENLNGDACGDFQAHGNQVTTVNSIKVVCTGDSTGALQIPHNVGVGAATNLVIVDTIPTHTTYVAESMKIGNAASNYALATSLTDATDGDAGRFSSPNVFFTIAYVPGDDALANSGSDEGKVYFKVRIN